ncbi:class I tRNA ligase family protein [Salinispora arenicola]|uniref:class I tRNA ligase family protein n=1 Tax=Salinispora arenicola TaxID=168697 RepID=UPI00036D7137|nr:class I tRNA ligase family protein [Salinispora arenicola]
MTADPHRPAVIIAATPTPNGDLHLGHLAGPYLAADVYARHLRMSGRPVVYTTCTDDSQSYVLTTARRQGVPPRRLAATAATAIARSLDAVGISTAGLPPTGDTYRGTVLDFVGQLHAAGRFRQRRVRLPYARHAGMYLYDGLLSGTCPTCLSDSSGGVCEACGHPNTFDDLLDPRYSLDPDDPVEPRVADVLVLPAEDYRGRLAEYYARHTPRWRPHARRLVNELLARPLPDIPVTVPGSWGIPAPFAQTPGQVLYPWIEAMPASIYSTWWSRSPRGATGGNIDAPWRAETDTELVYFHGYDNVYHWGLVDLVLLLAHGDRYVLPAANVCNEFYELAGAKFSTSRDHLVHAPEVLAEVPRDLLRFYLALTAPEYQRSTFDRATLPSVTQTRLVEPWNRLSRALDRALDASSMPARLPTDEAGRRRAAIVADRFRTWYGLPEFSIRQAADTLSTHVDRLARQAEALTGDPTDTGGLVVQVRALLAGAAPLLVDTAAAAAASGWESGDATAPSTTVAALRLPPLAGVRAPQDGRLPVR